MTSDISVTSTLSLFDTTKEQQQLFCSLLVEQMDLGNVDPLKIHYQVKCMEKIIEFLTDGKSELSKRYKAIILDVASKGRTIPNAEIAIKEYGVKYDYSGCGDKSLLEQMDLYEAMGKAIKKRQEFLKTISDEGLIITDPDTGETIKVYPPVKTSTTAVQLTLK